jgi:hypothetical protein
MHGDDEPFGPVHRVTLFHRFPRQVRLADAVSIMNRAATEDVRAPVWPVLRSVLRTGPAPSPLARRVVDLLDNWMRRGAPRLDADNDGLFDEAGPTIMDAVWRPIAEAVMRPIFGDLVDDLDGVRSLAGTSCQSYLDKDLRTLLRRRVRGPFNLRYCGRGSLRACRTSLWSAIGRTADALAALFANPDPAGWRTPAERTGFVPGLIPSTIRQTNRPTCQQVLELRRRRR